MTVEVVMPEMGEGVMEGTVIAWLKQEGDIVQTDEPVLEVETDKVTVEVTADGEGVLLKRFVDAGATVAVGTVLGSIGDQDEANGNGILEQVNGSQEPEIKAVISAPAYAPRNVNGVRVSPVVARMVQQHSIDVSGIEGTGAKGRITKRDVEEYLNQADQTPVVEPMGEALPPVDDVEPTSSDEEIISLSAMRRSIAEHMVQSKHTSPHVTTVFEFDFSKVSEHRSQHKEAFASQGIKLTYMSYIMQATAGALREFPQVNGQWTDEGIRLNSSINIGVAVAIPDGLIVPVVRNADHLNLFGSAHAVQELAGKARNNRLLPQDVQGGTFTITNHGASGSLIGTPIINQPQVGILGVGAVEKRVKVINDAIAIRLCAYISFSFDHRVLDGASADAFISAIKDRIENWD